MAEKMRRYKKDVAIFFEELTRLKEFVDSHLKNANLCEVKLRLEYLIQGFENFKRSQTAIENLDVDEQEDKTSRGRAESAYFLYRPRLEVHIQKLERDQQNQAPKPVQCNDAKFNPKLPVIDLPSFSGKILEWSDFYESFQVLVHNNTGLSNQLKFQFLRNSLTGDAAEIIRSLEFNEKNYNEALSLLKERYDNQKHICEEHIRSLFYLKSIENPSSLKLLSLLDSFNAHLRALTTLGRPVATWDDLIIHLFISKLDRATISKWVDKAPPTRMATFAELSSFIKSECYKLELQPHIKPTSTNSKSNKPGSTQRFRHNSLAASSVSRYYCVICKTSGHSIYRCSTFLSKSIEDRRKLVEEFKLCFNCMKDDHFSSKCTTSSTCQSCKKRHHTLLHPSKASNDSNTASNASTLPTVLSVSQASTLQTATTSTSKSYVFLATAVVKFTNKFGNPVLGRVLLDSGSQLNFATEAFCSKLGINRSKSKASVFGIGNSTVSPRFSSTVTLKSRTSNYTSTIDIQILSKITQPQPTVPVNISRWNIPPNIQLADTEFFKPQQVDVLLGAESFSELILDGQIQIGNDLPVLQNTVFGWVVWGKATNMHATNESVSINTCLTSFINIEQQIEQFWKLESQTEQPAILSTEEQQCEDHFIKNTTRDSAGKFVVRLPFQKPPTILGQSYQMAHRRFLNLEKRLQRNPELHKSYCEFMAEYIHLGHMQPISTEEIQMDDCYYFPHHCVQKADSSTTKLRVVFDGSAKTTSGVSLNDILMVGAVVQNDLFSILVRFRAHRFVFSTDITKMYRQINVHPDDAKYQLILWRNQPDDTLQSFKLTTVTYGTAAAPFLATRCLQELASTSQQSHPLGSITVRDDTYVDDILTGANSIDSLLTIKQQIIDMLQSAGMELRKWYSNTSDILADVPLENQESLLKLDTGDFIKTLGVHWQPLNDEFHININLSPSSLVTKRSVISDIARVFDPLGLAAPVVTLGKLFMQRLWNMKLEWDDTLPDGLVRDWQQFKNDLPQLRSLHIPRHLFNFDSPTYIELHGFSDASEKAYGAAIYTRCQLSNHNFFTSLLCAKSRVAPLLKVSLPRLELCAAKLLAELMYKILSIINFNVAKAVYWSDSTITLHWIKGNSSSWKTFVANRVSIIQQLSSIESWRHVDSKNNPADVISRGCSPSQLISSTLWLHGPKFLSDATLSWPPNLMAENEIEVPEQKKSTCTIAQCLDEHYFFTQIDNRYHSSYFQMQRIMAYVCRFLSNCRIKKSTTSERQYGLLTPSEINTGLISLVKAVQSTSFHDEIRSLQRRKTISKNPLKSLSAFLDKDGVLRVGGRIQKSSLSYSTKHPIVLPKTHFFTITIISFYHNRYQHAAPQALLAAVREMFWPINGRRLATKVYKQCRVCFKANPRTHNQIMGNLPSKRLQPSPPFYTIGVDFCGPLYAHFKVRGRAPVKVYVCVIVCFSVKAVHLELVGDMSTPAFLGALKRFVATRGLCRDIFSDNGTNFIGANSCLNDVYKMFNSKSHFEMINHWCEENKITWHFAPPGSPHFGGIYEAAVKSAKFHLRRVVGDAHLTYEELLTVIKQTEAVLNSRPITPLSSSPDDYNALTPGHFLIGRPLLALPDRDYSSESLPQLRRWELVTGIVQHFWIRWNREYLTTLQNRYKWQTESQNLKVNDMVIVKDENLPPTKWLLARVVAVHPGVDGKVRVATIKTKGGIYKRPIVKLCPLPMSDENVIDS